MEESYKAPRTRVEEILAEIWAEVLKLERIGIHDNFFDLGGHSLKATQVISRLRTAFQIDLPLRALFETPTVAGLAAMITQRHEQNSDSEKLAQFIAELESLSDEEVHRILA